MVVFGTVINREGAILQSLIPSYREATQEQMGLFNRQQLNLRTQTELQSRMGPGITQGLIGLGPTIGAAGLAGVGGLVGNLSAAMGEMVQFFKKFTPKAFAEATGGVLGQAAAEGQTRDLANIQVLGNELAIAFEKNIGPLLGKYLQILKYLLGKVGSIANFIEYDIMTYFGSEVKGVSFETAQALPQTIRSREIVDLEKTIIPGFTNTIQEQRRRLEEEIAKDPTGIPQALIRERINEFEAKLQSATNKLETLQAAEGAIRRQQAVDKTSSASTAVLTQANQQVNNMLAQIEQKTAERLDIEEGNVLSFNSTTVAELGRSIVDGLKPILTEFTQATLVQNDLLSDGNRIAKQTNQVLS
jgi:hypothetical protein